MLPRPTTPRTRGRTTRSTTQLAGPSRPFLGPVLVLLVGAVFLGMATSGQQVLGVACVAAGVVLVRQRPGSAKGVVFMTIEDETGIANAVVWPKTLERFRKVVMGARLIVIHGRIQRHESHQGGRDVLPAEQFHDKRYVRRTYASLSVADGGFAPP